MFVPPRLNLWRGKTENLFEFLPFAAFLEHSLHAIDPFDHDIMLHGLCGSGFRIHAGVQDNHHDQIQAGSIEADI